MKPLSLSSMRGVVALAGIALFAATAGAAEPAYPDKPITFVSAFAPGATNDTLTRLVARGVATALHTSEVVENRAGANGIVGTQYVARAKPDGYTLLTANSASHGINPSLYPDIPYNALKDFQGISMMASVPLAIAASASLPVSNLKELVAYGAAHPGKLGFATSGIGGTGHLTGEAFKFASHLDMVHVPYKGDALAVTDTMAGQVPLCIVALSAVTPMLASGKIKLLAVASAKRLPLLPEVPTIDESGFPGMEFSQWFAIVAPSGTPAPVVDKLNLAIKGIIESDAAKTSIAALGAVPVYTTPAQTQAFIEAEIERFGAIIAKLHLQLR
ncbi:MAG TPA: tripartite tricarboxylate transporter substrate binding protein [Burkholderiaceae bacterium]